MTCRDSAARKSGLASARRAKLRQARAFACFARAPTPMAEDPRPTAEQLRRYRQRALNGPALLALSDYFARHPEQRPQSQPDLWRSEGPPAALGYEKLVAQL